jgi:uncharacterized protein
MSFNDRSRLDPNQVQDRRGRGRGRTIAVGGGGLTLVVIVVAMLFGVDLSDLAAAVDTGQQVSYSDQGTEGTYDLQAECQTGADANTRQDCRIVGFVNSIQAFWEDEFARNGIQYAQADTVIFSGATEAGCGYASAAVGPFYCPRDQQVYLDLSFFNDLETRFGAQGGSFAEAYVLAHEYGHHVQNLLGVLSSSNATGPDSEAVETELQADCLAGVWLFHATDTGYLNQITEQDVIQALDAAASVGDDRIQRETRGYVSPESWTHGSSEQRQLALKDGLQSGDIDTCNSPGWTE